MTHVTFLGGLSFFNRGKGRFSLGFQEQAGQENPGTGKSGGKSGDRRDVFWYCLDRGSISSGGGGGGSAPCDAAGQCSAIPSGFRRRAVRLPGFAARGGTRGRLVRGGLLRDVESRASGADSASSRGL